MAVMIVALLLVTYIPSISLFLTGTRELFLEKMWGMGVDYFFLKPMDHRQVCRVVRKVLDRKRGAATVNESVSIGPAIHAASDALTDI
ncbi:MAG: hypothetical protein KKG47_07405 [Proteobacteria bacterium]|nr:hypothetical protein [Pseudomonadota bacterium]MBU1739533.1 hypothetical protein [Pseudomonadota bacterium]